MDDDTLTKAIIGTIGDVDAYQLPDAKGYSRYGVAIPSIFCMKSFLLLDPLAADMLILFLLYSMPVCL